jgi:hypothetical protein
MTEGGRRRPNRRSARRAAACERYRPRPCWLWRASSWLWSAPDGRWPGWLASLAGQAARYRRSSGERRQQLKWLLGGCAVALAGLAIKIVLTDAARLKDAVDLAASTASQRLDGPRILAAYGGPVDAGQLAVCQRLRRLHLTVW